MTREEKEMREYTDELKYSLDIIHNQVSYAETKNGVFLGFLGALVVGILSCLDGIKEIVCFNVDWLKPFNENMFNFILLIFLLLIVIAIFFLCRSFYPNITSKLTEDRAKNKTNLLFFSPNQSEFKSSEDLLNHYYEKYKNIKKYQLDISNQIYNLSRIARFKYKSFEIAFSLVISAFISIIPAFLISYLLFAR